MPEFCLHPLFLPRGRLLPRRWVVFGVVTGTLTHLWALCPRCAEAPPLGPDGSFLLPYPGKDWDRLPAVGPRTPTVHRQRLAINPRPLPGNRQPPTVDGRPTTSRRLLAVVPGRPIMKWRV